MFLWDLGSFRQGLVSGTVETQKGSRSPGDTGWGAGPGPSEFLPVPFSGGSWVVRRAEESVGRGSGALHLFFLLEDPVFLVRLIVRGPVPAAGFPHSAPSALQDGV